MKSNFKNFLFSNLKTANKKPESLFSLKSFILGLFLLEGAGWHTVRCVVAHYLKLGEQIFDRQKLTNILYEAKIPDYKRLAEKITSCMDALIEKGSKEYEKLKREGIDLLVGEELPDFVSDFNGEKPLWLFIKGDKSLLYSNKYLRVGIIGTRNPSAGAEDYVKKLVWLLAHYPVIIVSGLANGIDSFAHRISIDKDLKNVAFLGHGLHISISKESKKSFASIFATVIIERIFDLIYLLLFLSILLFFTPFSISSNIIIIASFELAGIIVFIGLIFILSIIKFEEKFIIFIKKILKPFPKKIEEALINFSISLIEGSKTLKIVYKNIFFHVSSFLVAFFQALIFIMIIYSLNIKISLSAALIISLIITLSHALPAAPGYIGSFQIVWIAIFSLIGLPIETIISSSIIANFINLLYTLFISGILASIYGFKISEYLELTLKKKYY